MAFELSISADDRARFQIEDGWNAGYARIVEWQDVDAFAHANHTAFLLWFETARNRYLEAVGLPRHAVDQPGPVMMSLQARYIRPLSYHDAVFITARTKSMRTTSFVMEYAAWSDEGCAATCEAVLVLMINESGQKIAIPAPVRTTIRVMDAPAEN